MSELTWKYLVIIVPLLSALLTVLMRFLSHFEHKKTENKVNNIYLILNGELLKKIEESKEAGRQEERNKKL